MKEHIVVTCVSKSDKANMVLHGKDGNKGQLHDQGSRSGNIVVCLGLVGVSIAIAASVWYPVQKLSEEIKDMQRTADRTTNEKESYSDTGTQNSKIHRPLDCFDVQENKDTVSGVYTIYPGSTRRGFPVYCDLDTDGGGWTVLQQRLDGSLDFMADWQSYQFGFGNLSGEFWLGNEFTHMITQQAWYVLRIDMEDFDGESRYAEYQLFNIAGREDEFKLTVGGYRGNAGDSFSTHNGHKFSTKDRDNDFSPGSCAETFKGGWWYSNCLNACLNGQYHVGKHTTNADGINWFHWKGYNYSLKKTRMMIRPL